MKELVKKQGSDRQYIYSPPPSPIHVTSYKKLEGTLVRKNMASNEADDMGRTKLPFFLEYILGVAA